QLRNSESLYDLPVCMVACPYQSGHQTTCRSRMLCLGMGGDPLPHASLRGNCAEINAAGDPASDLSRIGWPITIRPRLRTALLMTCRISGAANAWTAFSPARLPAAGEAAS